MPVAPPFMLTTGPVTAYPAVLNAMARPVLYDGHPAFQQFYRDVVGKVRQAMRSAALPVILQGDALLGLEAAAASLIGRRDVVLNLVSGVYGKGYGNWARRHGGEVIELEVPYDEAIDAEAVRRALLDRPDITIIAVCHHDTPSGTLNPLAEIGLLAREHGAFVIADAVSSFGGMDVHPDAAHVDVFVASAAKCLGATPGLTLIGINDRAWARIKANPDAPRVSFLSLLDWELASEPGRPFPVTPSLAEFHGLDAALDLYLAEGPEKVWQRHARTAAATRAGLAALGLRLWPKSEAIAAPSASVFRVPDGIEDKALRDTLLDRYGVLVSLGRGFTAGKVLRIGHMGPGAEPLLAVTAIAALGAALRRLGAKGDAGVAVDAALASLDGPSPAAVVHDVSREAVHAD
ncbi:pyridoxamine--pyruvate transaminase [Labrys monachus]|uniref:Pyridoxamine--pyruvate transaminase n=1 Tax=Labrys monachus TaxID=217067 RepID=A0ABU0F9H7_9HYPH|nr:alanine--glyoxylate aminotransferase family protein [Labrys monachus]MDQ0391268.1 pyridoxamine--pyruvate transaminase [Labrys monachus]